MSSVIVNGPGPGDFSNARKRHQIAVAMWIPGEIHILDDQRDVKHRICCAVRVQESRMEMSDSGPIEVQTAFARIAKEDLPGGIDQGVIVRINNKGFKVEFDPADNAHDESWIVEFSRAPGSDLEV
jgi:hypothetical protein